MGAGLGTLWLVASRRRNEESRESSRIQRLGEIYHGSFRQSLHLEESFGPSQLNLLVHVICCLHNRRFSVDFRMLYCFDCRDFEAISG